MRRALLLALLALPLPALASPPTASVPRVLAEVTRTLRSTRYRHDTLVDVARGRYEWDCSGMTDWVLSRAAPAAERAIERRRATTRPLARDYHAAFSSLALHPDPSWQPVARVADARPGDLLAWVFPPSVHVAITGHVAFVVAAPVPVANHPGAYRVRIADSTSVPHDDDSRDRTGQPGYGTGVIELTTDARGAPTGYRWNTRPGRGLLRTAMSLARPLR